MIYTRLTKMAMRICFDAHKEQTDKSGMPYVFHPFHLAEQMTTEDTVVTALLHDVIEDTPYTLEDLAAMGFGETVLSALKLLCCSILNPIMKTATQADLGNIVLSRKRFSTAYRKKTAFGGSLFLKKNAGWITETTSSPLTAKRYSMLPKLPLPHPTTGKI